MLRLLVKITAWKILGSVGVRGHMNGMVFAPMIAALNVCFNQAMR